MSQFAFVYVPSFVSVLVSHLLGAMVALVSVIVVWSSKYSYLNFVNEMIYQRRMKHVNCKSHYCMKSADYTGCKRIVF